jgi:hypothetical protein
MGLTQVSKDGVKNDAIDASKLPANSVGASELADNAVDTNAIADQAVALSKLPHGDGSSDGKFLRANNGADPSFESIPAGTTINNNADNRVITGSGSANTLEGETGFTFDASTTRLKVGAVNNDNATIHALAPSDGGTVLAGSSAGGNGGNTRFQVKAFASGGTYGGGLKVGTRNSSNVDGTRVTIDHNGSVGIGTTQQDWKFQVFGGRTTFTDPNSVYTIGLRKNSTQNNNRNVWLGASAANDNSNPDFIISDNAGTEKFRFRTSGGLAFNGDTAAANALDDYEEGGWTPTWNMGSGSTGNQFSWGKYVKIGAYVHCMFALSFGSNGLNGSSGEAGLAGLPFACQSPNASGPRGGTGSLALGYGAPTTLRLVVVNGTTGRFMLNDGTFLQHNTSGINTGYNSCQISGSFTYNVAIS